ncbi:thioredoxin [Candidatus Uhrbacteria bacterium]|nr:thioredoxin [Candidatus Uhrbacteria bacterium]
MLSLTTENFDQIVLQSAKPVFVDFWAPWCGPCKIMGPIVEQLSGEIEGVEVGKVNVDDHSELAQRYNILSIPTFIIFKGGQPVEQFSGTMSKDQLKEKLEKYI